MSSSIKLTNSSGKIVTITNPDTTSADVTVDLLNNAYTIATVNDFDIVPVGYTTVIVKDTDRGGVFNRIASTTANGGTIFDGTTGYSWERQYSGAVNVKWFGAKGDYYLHNGSINPTPTDDTKAIQSAINNFDNVLLDAGTYYITTSLLLNNNSCIVGTINSRITSDGTFDTIVGDSKYNIEINTIKFLSSSHSDNGKAIAISHGYNISIKNIQIENSANAGIIMHDCDLVEISNSVVMRTASDGIHITGGCKNVLITNNLVTETADDGISSIGYKNEPLNEFIVISNNSVFNTGNNYIPVPRGSRGIAVGGSRYVTISGNTIDKCWFGGITIVQDSTDTYEVVGSSDIVISNNSISNDKYPNSHSGLISVWNWDNYSISNISIVDNILKNAKRCFIDIICNEYRGYNGYEFNNFNISGNICSGYTGTLDSTTSSINIQYVNNLTIANNKIDSGNNAGLSLKRDTLHGNALSVFNADITGNKITNQLKHTSFTSAVLSVPANIATVKDNTIIDDSSIFSSYIGIDNTYKGSVYSNNRVIKNNVISSSQSGGAYDTSSYYTLTGSLANSSVCEIITSGTSKAYKFADGTLIQSLRPTITNNISTSAFGGFRSSSYGFNLPVSFTDTNYSVSGNSTNTNAFLVSCTKSSASQVNLIWGRVTSADAIAMEANIMAIGRWY